MLVAVESMEDVKEDVLEPEIEILGEILSEIICFFFWLEECQSEFLKIIKYVCDPCKNEDFKKFY